MRPRRAKRCGLSFACGRRPQKRHDFRAERHFLPWRVGQLHNDQETIAPSIASQKFAVLRTLSRCITSPRAAADSNLLTSLKILLDDRYAAAGAQSPSRQIELAPLHEPAVSNTVICSLGRGRRPIYRTDYADGLSRLMRRAPPASNAVLHPYLCIWTTDVVFVVTSRWITYH